MRSFNQSLPMLLLRAREATMSYFRPLLQQHGLTEQQWRILRALHEVGAQDSGELAARCCILAPSMTGILKRMEAENLIQRQRSATDGRRIGVQMTDKSRALFDQLSPLVEARYQDIRDQLCPERLALLYELLEEMIDIEQPE
jgi:homoprotocatechuate degradation regulator HpaR